MGGCGGSLKEWLNGARRLDELGAKLRAVDLQLSYHNHAFEFEHFPDDNRTKEDNLLESTKPENLTAEFDLAWIYVGGADPAAYIRKYKGRCPTVHAKDVVKAKDGGFKFVPLGQGDLKWAEIFAAGDEAGIEWYIYEQDNADKDIFECAKESFDFLSKSLLG